MTIGRAKAVVPELAAKSFTCPTCGALAHQTWSSVRAAPYTKDDEPHLPSPDVIEQIKTDTVPAEQKDKLTIYFRRRLAKEIFFGSRSDPFTYRLENLEVSECYSCKSLALWHHDKILYPIVSTEAEIHEDCPPSLRSDLEEARLVLDQSPRSAAALLRLSIQKLCIELGMNGKNLSVDIGTLTKNGLDARVQKALDVVRVVGNNAVHPGQLDLKDDRATASKLFDLVNLIVEATITQPKMIDELYEKMVPAGAKAAIAKRDTAELEAPLTNVRAQT